MRVILFLFFVVQSSSLAADSNYFTDTISVSGEGELSINPDIAYITVAVETTDKNANAAQMKNANISSKIEKILIEKYRLQKSDLKTVQFQVYPEYNYANNRREFLDYKVINSLMISFRNLKEIGALLDTLSGAGANNIQGIQFDTEKRLEHEIEATRFAMDNAKKKADVIAKMAGRAIKKVLRAEEGQTWSGPPQPMSNFAKHGGMTMMAAEAATPIAAGTLKITARVMVLYQM